MFGLMGVHVMAKSLGSDLCTINMMHKFDFHLGKLNRMEKGKYNCYVICYIESFM